MFFSGQRLGSYTLVKTLGRGSFGEVWLANRETKFVTTKVAIKLPLREQVNAETIKQEAVLWEQASGHPNVLPIIEADEYDGQILIVSEYASGGTLDDLLEREGILPAKKAIEIAIGILNGLEFLHSRQIIHRDIKPANILLQGEIPRLTDFGLSRAVSGNSLSMSISINGTPYYMSPEAFNRKRNQQTDIWSFGVVLFKMVTGRLPFEGNDVAELYTAVFGNPPAPIPDYVPSLLHQIILKTLAKNPLERYSTAAEVREDLMRCQASLSAENLQIHQTSVNNIQVHKTDEPPLNNSSNSLSVATQTNLDPRFVITQDSTIPPPNFKVSKGTPIKRVTPLSQPHKSHKFKYLTVACLLLLSIFGTGFYLISKRTPIPMRIGDKFGYSNWVKELVIGAKYDRALQFSNDRALVAAGQNKDGHFIGKYGFIDVHGREIIPLEYDSAESFSGNLAKVGKLDAASNKILYGFINQNGEEVIPLKYDEARSFSGKFAIVKSQDKWGAIDDKGNLIVKPKYDWMDDFSEDVAAVKIGDKYSFVNTSGVELMPFAFDLAGKFSSDLAPVKKDGKSYFIDKQGNQSLPYKYENADAFSEGSAMVRQSGKSGFINNKGVEVIPFQYENDSARFSEGLAAVKQNGKFGFIDYSGRLIVPFKYVEAKPIKDNLSLVKNTDGKEFFIGYEGTEFYQP